MINYDTVKSDFEESKWKLLSTGYKNLDSEMDCICPEGHTQFITYRDWRKNKLCKICLQNEGAFVKANRKGKMIVPEKPSEGCRILSLDAATTTTGYAVYDDKNLVGYGHFTIKGDNTTQRINEVKQWLICAIDTWDPDFICLEHIQLQTFNREKSDYQVELYRVLANLQGVLVDTAFEKEKPLHLIYSQTWRGFCDIRGRNREEKKRSSKKD